MMQVKTYGSGTQTDEGGKFHYKDKPIPGWVAKARRVCGGCHDDFYNGRMNCTGNSWCFSLKPHFAKLKNKPNCYH